METITLNKSIGRTRRETLGGREYIVAPLSMLVPGVLNGSRGPLLYPPELVNRNPAVWNHMPIVVYHPMEQGKPTSARDPFILNKQGVGFVFRSRDNGKAEGWFDIENTKRVDPRVYDALVKNQPMELSTGLFTKNQKASPGSSFKGKDYVEVVRDFTPDHLAILPDQKGACSMKDGCGMLINEANLSALDKAQQIVENGSPNQPRDARGRWSGGGSGGSGSGGKAGGMRGGATGPSTSAEDVPYGVHPKMHATLTKAGYQESGGGDDHTMYSHSSDQNKVVLAFDKNNKYEVHDFSKQKGDSSAEAQARGKGSTSLAKHIAPAESHSQAKSGAATDSHETVKQMQKPGNTTNLANALTKAKEMTGYMNKSDRKSDENYFKSEHKKADKEIADAKSALSSALGKQGSVKQLQTQLSEIDQRIADLRAKKNSSAQRQDQKSRQLQQSSKLKQLTRSLDTLNNSENQEGSQFGKPHNNVKEKPNMAKQRQVQNEEVELTDDDREELIDMIVDNCACEEASDRETLNNLSDKTLSQLAINAIPPQFMKKKKPAAVAEDEEDDAEEDDEGNVIPAKKKPVIQNQANKTHEKRVVTMNQEKPAKSEKSELDSETKFLVNYAKKKMQEEKDVLIEKLVANASEDSIEELTEVYNEMDVERLELMVKGLPKVEKQLVQNSQRMRSSIREEQPESRGRNFTGAGGSLPRSQAKQVNNSRGKSKQDDDDPLAGPMESPTINYAEVAGFQNGNFIHRNNLGSMQSAGNN